MSAFNLYCDESCHLEHDHHKVMVLGAIMCPAPRTREIASQIRELKRRHGLPPEFEVKWTKVSASKVEFYLGLVDYFFAQDDVRFRALVVPDKSMLDHSGFEQTHDDFYYKQYFQMLKVLVSGKGPYRIFIDIKDTRSARKTKRLGDILSRFFRDSDRRRIRPIELVRSQQVQQIQLADLLIGAVSYANRGMSRNAGKKAIIDRIEQRSGISLTATSALVARKLNVFVWQAGEAPRRA